MPDSKLDRTWDDIFDRYRVGGREAITEAEHDWIRVSNFRYQVGNGGLSQYIYNPWDAATEFDDTIAALQRLGAPFAAVVIRDIAQLFESGAPFDTDERYNEFLSWPENSDKWHILDAADEKIASKLDALDELLDEFILGNSFCDLEDLD